MDVRSVILAGASAALLGGCAVAGAAVDVVTLPVKAVGAGVDMMTASQEEADRNRGREIRKREEAIADLAKDRDKASRKCLNQNDIKACDDMRALDWEIERLRTAPLN